MTRTLSFGDSGDARRTLASWVPKLREIVARLIRLEEDIYTDSETLTNKLFFGDRVHRKVVNIGALPNATTKTVAHGISDFARMWIASESFASDGTNIFPLPYPDVTSSSTIEVRANQTLVTIVTGANYSAYNGLVVLEYTKKKF